MGGSRYLARTISRKNSKKNKYSWDDLVSKIRLSANFAKVKAKYGVVAESRLVIS